MATKKPLELAPEVLDTLQHIATGIAEHNEREREAARNTPEARAEWEAIRRPLRRMPFTVYARAIPDLLRAIASGTVVPDTYLTRSATATEIACPCGEKPTVADTPSFCACGRAYATVGRDVRVLFSPVKPTEADNT